MEVEDTDALLPTSLMSPSADLTRENARLKRQLAAMTMKLRAYEAVPTPRSSSHRSTHVVNASTEFTQRRLAAIGGPAKQVILTFTNEARLDLRGDSIRPGRFSMHVAELAVASCMGLGRLLHGKVDPLPVTSRYGAAKEFSAGQSTRSGPNHRVRYISDR